MKRIIFVTFQGVAKGIPWGMAKSIFPILNAFDESAKKNIVYYLSRVEKYDGQFNLKELSKSYLLIIRIVFFINRYLKIIPPYKLRLFQEKLFDYFVSIKIQKTTIIISTAYLYKTIKKNNKLGGLNILLAGNPDDYEIHHLLKKEQQKYKVSFNDAYTHRKRIDFVSKSISSFDHIVCFTISELESYRKRIPHHKISFVEARIMPNPKTFPEKALEKRKELTFCYVAHTVWLKGIIYLLEAWEKTQIKNARLLIAGTINKEVKEYIKKRFYLLENVDYLGRVEDLNHFFRTSHVCIVPSLLDAGPTTVAEAMYCGLPVIVSDGCGTKTLVKEGKNGFVVPTGNAKGISEKIDWFYKNQAAIPVMGKNASETIKTLENSDQHRLAAEHIMNVVEKVKEQKR